MSAFPRRSPKAPTTQSVHPVSAAQPTSDDHDHLSIPAAIDPPDSLSWFATGELDEAVRRESAIGIPDAGHHAVPLLSEEAFAACHDREQAIVQAWSEDAAREHPAVVAAVQDAVREATARRDAKQREVDALQQEVDQLVDEIDEPHLKRVLERPNVRAGVAAMTMGFGLVEVGAVRGAVARARGTNGHDALPIAVLLVFTTFGISFYAGSLAHRALLYEGPVRLRRALWSGAGMLAAGAVVLFIGTIMLRMAGDRVLMETTGRPPGDQAWMFYVALQVAQLFAAVAGWGHGSVRTKELEGARQATREAEHQLDDLIQETDELTADLAELEGFEAEAWASQQSAYISQRYTEHLVRSRAAREELLVDDQDALLMVRSLPRPTFIPAIPSATGLVPDAGWVNGFTLTF